MTKIYLGLEEKRALWKARDKRLAVQQKGYKDKRVKANKIIIATYKAKGCSICGYNKCDKSLVFHHLGLDVKRQTVSKLYAHSAEVLITEIEKCIVVCANCHAEIHDRLKRRET